MNIYEGVNTLLSAIGEIPITDNTQAVEAESTSDVGIALTTLLNMSRSIQQEGYWFNKELGYPLVPNTEGEVAIGSNILNIYSPSLIIKDHKLYDTTKRTYLFSTTQEVDVVFDVLFDDLPYVVADTITKEAAVEFYNNILGDTQELGILQTSANKARLSLQKQQIKNRKANLMSGSRLLNRTQNPTGIN